MGLFFINGKSGNCDCCMGAGVDTMLLMTARAG